MEISMTTTTTTTSPNSTTKSPEQADTETHTPTTIHSKLISFTNGVLKRHHQNQKNHLTMTVPPVEGLVSYKECLKNHAAALGGHALDGCGEFMPSPNADTNPTSLKCAACGCHRNFHRREPDDPLPPSAVIQYQPHHRYHPPPPGRSSVSPPPISSYYPSAAPRMLLALSTGMPSQQPQVPVVRPSPISRKRFRTRFSQSQKEKMHHFAEKLGWKMLKKDEDFVQEFCNEIGVEKGVFKVWMHNNKNTYAKKDNGIGTDLLFVVDHQSNHDSHHNKNNNNDDDDSILNGNDLSENVNQYQNDIAGHVGTNGSSSSS